MDNRCIKIPYSILLLHDNVDLVVKGIMTKLPMDIRTSLYFPSLMNLLMDELISRVRTSISSFEILFDL